MKRSSFIVASMLFLGFGCFAFGEIEPEKPGDGPKDQPGPQITIGTGTIPGGTSGTGTGNGTVVMNPDGSVTVSSTTTNADGSITTTIITVNPDGTSSTSSTTTSSPTTCIKNGEAFYNVHDNQITACFGAGDECTYIGPCAGSN